MVTQLCSNMLMCDTKMTSTSFGSRLIPEPFGISWWEMLDTQMMLLGLFIWVSFSFVFYRRNSFAHVLAFHAYRFRQSIVWFENHHSWTKSTISSDLFVFKFLYFVCCIKKMCGTREKKKKKKGKNWFMIFFLKIISWFDG